MNGTESSKAGNGPRKLNLEKWIWTEEDFQHMIWHDVRIHAMSIREILMNKPSTGLGELLFDIDYILRSEKPTALHDKPSFWLAPATLAFQNVWELRIGYGGGEPKWNISNIRRQPSNKTAMGKANAWLWTIELEDGMFSFFSTGYEQYIRKKPVKMQDQHLSFEERGSESFLKQTPTDAL